MEIAQVDRSELRDKSTLAVAHKLDISDFQAGEIIDQFEYAELAGKRTHGYVRVPWLLEQPLKGHQELSFPDLSDPVIHVDCTRSIGYLAANEITSYIRYQTNTKQSQTVVAHNIFPTNVLGYHARHMLGSDNRFSLIFGTTPKLVTGPSMQYKLLGTNPMAIGFSHNGIESVLDITTASNSLGELLVAKYWGGFNPREYRTFDGKVPAHIDDLYNEGQFTGSIVQSVETKSESRQYALNIMIQLLVGSLACQESSRGSLVFGAFDLSLLGANGQYVAGSMAGDDLCDELLPGTKSYQKYLEARELPTVDLPTKLWQDITDRV